MKSSARVLYAVCLCLLPWATTNVSASGNTQWTEIGPFGGTLTVIRYSPLVKGLVYAGTAFGGVFVSTNDGVTWAPKNAGVTFNTAFDSQSIFVADIGFDPLNPQLVYMTTGKFLYKLNASINAWQSIYTVPGQLDRINYIAIDPFNTQHIILSGSFTYQIIGDTEYMSSEVQSQDGGVTWNYNPEGTGGGGRFIQFSPLVQGLVFSSDYNSYSYRSTDDGNTWQNMNGAAVYLAVSPSNQNRVYSANTGAVFRSDDMGASSTQVYALPQSQNNFDVRIYVDPKNSDVVYVLMDVLLVGGVMDKSTDGGQTWTTINIPPSFRYQNPTLAIDPMNNSHLITVDKDVYSSWDGGNHFAISDTGMAAHRITAVVADNSNPPTIYAGTNVYNAYGTVLRSKDGGAHWDPFIAGRTTNCFDSTVTSMDMDWFNQGYVYAGTADTVDTLSPGSTSWNPVCLGDYGFSMVSASPLSAGVLYAGFGPDCAAIGICDLYVLKSTDHGSTWQEISDVVLTEANTAYVAQSFLTPNLIYSAYQVPLSPVFKSTNGGLNWTLLPGTIASNSWITAFAASPVNDMTLFAAGCDSISRTTDGGSSWSKVYQPGLSCGVNTVYADPTAPGTVYGGTSAGLVVSTDNGSTWSPSPYPGLENHSVNVIDHPKWNSAYMYAGTTDASVFSLTNPPDLNVGVSGPGPIIPAGSESQFDVTVNNPSALQVIPVALDIIPPANTMLSVQNANGGTCAADGNGAPGETVCDLSTLADNSSWKVSIGLTPSASFQVGALQAEVGSGQGDQDWLDNAVADELVTTSSDTAVTVTTISSALQEPYSGPLFSVTVVNNGPSNDGAYVHVNYTPDANSVQLTSTGASCTQLTSGFECSLSQLSVGTPVTLDFSGSINSVSDFIAAAEILPMTANDPDTSNNTSAATMSVSPAPPAPPVVSDGSISINENTSVSGTLSATGTGPITFLIVTQPSSGKLNLTNASTGAFTYVPNNGFSGKDSFMFSASNAGGVSGTATESITVQAASAGSGSLPPPPSSGSGGGELGWWDLAALCCLLLLHFFRQERINR